MSKYGVFALILILLLSGCTGGTATENPATAEDTGNSLSTVKDDPAEESPDGFNRPEDKETVAQEIYGQNADKPAIELVNPVQPEAAGGKVLDFAMLDTLDNTRLAWGLRLNNRHEVPEVPVRTKELLAKYDGVYTGDTSEKVIYLTFDEGYENGYTPMILDTLKANDVKSIFFVTGPYIKSQPELVQRMLDEGHLVGNHTIKHPSLPTISNEALENELYGLEKQFVDAFGKGFRYMRPPMGEYSEKVLAAARQLGYKTVFWSFAYLDYDVNNQKGPDNAYNVVMNNLHNGAVILLHAVSKDNAEALDRIIKGIREQGYEIRPFDL